MTKKDAHVTPIGIDIEHLSIDELRKRVDQTVHLVDQVAQLLPGLVTLTADDRRHSEGRLRDGEDCVLRAVLDGVDSAPYYFTALADKDGGTDPATFETQLLRDRLERRQLLAQLQQKLDTLNTEVSDTVLRLGEEVRPVALAAYRIGKAVAGQDAKLRAQLAPVIDFYSTIGRRGAQTRQDNKAKKAGEGAHQSP